MAPKSSEALLIWRAVYGDGWLERGNLILRFTTDATAGTVQRCRALR